MTIDAASEIEKAISGKIYRYDPTGSVYLMGQFKTGRHPCFKVYDLTAGFETLLWLENLRITTPVDIKDLTSDEAYNFAHYEREKGLERVASAQSPNGTSNHSCFTRQGEKSGRLVGYAQTQPSGTEPDTRHLTIPELLSDDETAGMYHHPGSH